MANLANLLRKDQKPDLDDMIRRVVEGYRFLGDLTDAEQLLTADGAQKNRKEAQALTAVIMAIVT